MKLLTGTAKYSNDTLEKNDDFELIEIGDEIKITTREPARKEQTLWSEKIEGTANYIAMKFRITEEESCTRKWKCWDYLDGGR